MYTHTCVCIMNTHYITLLSQSDSMGPSGILGTPTIKDVFLKTGGEPGNSYVFVAVAVVCTCSFRCEENLAGISFLVWLPLVLSWDLGI